MFYFKHFSSSAEITVDRLYETLTYVRCFTFSVPTVTSVMGHLIVHVLSETELLWLDAYFHQEEVDTSHEVTESLVGNQFLKRQIITCNYNLHYHPKNVLHYFGML